MSHTLVSVHNHVAELQAAIKVATRLEYDKRKQIRQDGTLTFSAVSECN
jgi:hypothetical protein